MKKDGILANDLDKKESTTRDRITEVLGANVFTLVQTLSDELEELDLERVTTQEFMVTVEGVLYSLYLYKAEEESPEK